VAQTATTTLSFSPAMNSPESSSFAYGASEYPFGGTAMMSLSKKESQSTAAIGASITT
jgi:hypothetical protein